MLFHKPWLMLSPNSGSNGGGATTPPAAATPPAATTPPAAEPPATAPPAVTQSYENLLQRNGGDSSVVSWLLFNEAQQNRSDNQELRAQIQTLQAQIPAEEAMVLTPEQVELWTRYAAIGTPDEITQQASNYHTLQNQITIRDAASIHGYKASVLETLAAQSNIVIGIQEADDDNGRSAFVVTDEGQDNIQLADYVAANWKDFEPSLVLGSQGTQFIRQNTGSGNKPTGTAISRELDKRYPTE